MIRAALDATGTSHIEGQYHSTAGYRPGPPPAHPIGLSVGADRPRLLQVVGALADGWVSPLNIYVPPEAVPAAQAAIDRGTLDNGRDPTRIRRIYNVIGTIDGNEGNGLHGSATHWADTLADWHHNLGFDTFIFWPANNHDDQLERFAAEVVPHVRDLLDQPSERPLRSAANPLMEAFEPLLSRGPTVSHRPTRSVTLPTGRTTRAKGENRWQKPHRATPTETSRDVPPRVECRHRRDH